MQQLCLFPVRSLLLRLLLHISFFALPFPKSNNVYLLTPKAIKNAGMNVPACDAACILTGLLFAKHPETVLPMP
jgi:hypothetical protein